MSARAEFAAMASGPFCCWPRSKKSRRAARLAETFRMVRERGKWRRQRLKEQGGRCYYCKAELGRASATTDHVIPLSKGGPDTFENTVASCEPCNKAKGDTMPAVAA